MIDDTFGGQMMGQVRFPAVFDRDQAVAPRSVEKRGDQSRF